MKPDFDDERAFGGLRRLYGAGGYTRVRQARVAVVGVGGVGSWAVEALARSGVAALVLFDLDHVSESNINRQLQATTTSLGQAKVQALRERIVLIHPGCEVHAVEAFVTPENWPNILPLSVDAVPEPSAQAARARLGAGFGHAIRLRGCGRRQAAGHAGGCGGSGHDHA